MDEKKPSGVKKQIEQIIQNEETLYTNKCVIYIDSVTMKKFNFSEGQFIAVASEDNKSNIVYASIALKSSASTSGIVVNQQLATQCRVSVNDKLLLFLKRIILPKEVATCTELELYCPHIPNGINKNIFEAVYLEQMKHMLLLHSKDYIFQYNKTNAFSIPLHSQFHIQLETTRVSCKESVLYKMDFSSTTILITLPTFTITVEEIDSSISQIQQSISSLQYTYTCILLSISTTLLQSYKRFIINSLDPLLNKGCLLFGESGIGKSHLCHLLVQIFSPQQWYICIVDCIAVSQSANAEQYLTQTIEKCKHHSLYKKSILILDHLEYLAKPRQSSTSQERTMLKLVLQCIDDLYHSTSHFIYVIGTCNHTNQIDIALRRVNRLEFEYEMKIPTITMRRLLLQEFSNHYSLSIDTTLMEVLLDHTHGYIASDLMLLMKQLAMQQTTITRQLILHILSLTRPTCLSNKNMLLTKTEFTLQDLIGIESIVKQLETCVLNALSQSKKHLFTNLGIQPPKGVLLYGPSGNGKTALAQAIANEVKANFIAVQCTDILSKVVGESSQRISQLFKQARAAAPCILFFDQFESLARTRGSDSTQSHSADQLLSTFLIEMDGVNSSNENVLLLAATNRKDMIDAAMLRPGRIDLQIHIPQPNAEARRKILLFKLSKIQWKEEISSTLIEELVHMTEGRSSAEVEGICREAALRCVRQKETRLTEEHLKQAAAHSIGSTAPLAKEVNTAL